MGVVYYLLFFYYFVNDKFWIRYCRLKKLFSDGFVYVIISYIIVIMILFIIKNVVKKFGRVNNWCWKKILINEFCVCIIVL